jgi:hypothetical protein
VHQSGDEVSGDGVEEGKTIRLQINPDSNSGDTTMKKIALITALVIGTGSVALATEFDPNLANRYPSYTAPQAQSMTTKDVSLGGGSAQWQSPTFDRASNPNAGGV